MQTLAGSVRTQIRGLCGELSEVQVVEHRNGGVIILVGTAHVRLKSSDLVKKICTLIEPDRIFLELCSERKGLLKQKKIDSKKAPKGPLTFNLNSMLARGQGVVGRKLHIDLIEDPSRVFELSFKVYMDSCISVCVCVLYMQTLLLYSRPKQNTPTFAASTGRRGHLC